MAQGAETGLPRGTAALLVRELAGATPVAEDYIAWATRLLEDGSDSPALRSLAGLDMGRRCARGRDSRRPAAHVHCERRTLVRRDVSFGSELRRVGQTCGDQ